jgi:hypothetical protein
VAGCGVNGKGLTQAQRDAKAKEDQKDKDQQIFSQAGEATGWTKTGTKQQLWQIAWESVELTFQPDGNSFSKMKNDHGSFYQKGEEASRFQSATAESDKAKGDIDVNGNVVVISLAHNVTLRCDHIHYASKGEQIVKATGNVQVDGQFGTVSGLQEVWATPDLKTFGTPDLFEKR